VEGEACGKRKATPDLGEEPTTEGVGACAKKSCSGGGRKVIVDWEKRARGWRRHSLCRAPVPLCLCVWLGLTIIELLVD
jgi:hypothetical protein